MRKSELINGVRKPSSEVSLTSQILKMWNEDDQSVGEIATALGIKYQHVYNTLVRKGEITPKSRD